jgi:hypothetical protein
LTEAQYRSLLVRFAAMRFIEINTVLKGNSIYINVYGKAALSGIEQIVNRFLKKEL